MGEFVPIIPGNIPWVDHRGGYWVWHCISSRVVVNGRLGGKIISGVKGILLPLSSSHSSTTRPSRYGILCLAIARRSLSKFPLRNLEKTN